MLKTLRGQGYPRPIIVLTAQAGVEHTVAGLEGGAAADMTKPFSFEQILDRIWGFDYDPGTNLVNGSVGHQRKKLGGDRIETVRGVGYRLRPSTAVGTHPAGTTPEGIHDLAGNVAEWTHSLYRPYPYQADDGREDAAVAGERLTRGGDHVFDSAPDELKTFFRAGFSRAPDLGHRHIGFRCAQSVS